MQIIVQRTPGGMPQVIELDGPCTILIGQVLNRIQDSDGREYFFTKDGYYDGFGQSTAAKQEVGE